MLDRSPGLAACAHCGGDAGTMPCPLCGKLVCATCSRPLRCPSGLPFRLDLDGVVCDSVDGAGEFALGRTRWGRIRIIDLERGSALPRRQRVPASSWPRVVTGARLLLVQHGPTGVYRGLKVCSLVDQARELTIGAEGEALRPRRLVVSSDDQLALLVLGDGSVSEVIDLRTEQRIGRYGDGREVSALDGSREAGILASASFGCITLRDLTTGERIDELSVGSVEVHGLGLAGRSLVALTGDGRLQLAELSRDGRRSRPRSVSLAASERREAFTAYGFRLEREVPLRSRRIVALSPDGALLAFAGEPGRLQVHSLGDERPPLTIALPGRELHCLRFTHGGERLVAATHGALSIFPRRALLDGTAAQPLTVVG